MKNISAVHIQYLDGEYVVTFEHYRPLDKQYEHVPVARARLIRDILNRAEDWISVSTTFFKNGVNLLWIRREI